MQKTFIYRNYTAAVRENGKATRIDFEMVDLSQNATEKREDALATLLLDEPNALMFFRNNEAVPNREELRAMDNAIWAKEAHTLKEGQSKAGKVTRTEKAGYTVHVVKINADFEEYGADITVKTEEEATLEAITAKDNMVVRVESVTESKDCVKYLTEREFYNLSKPV